jgi:hypothetical protein
VSPERHAPRASLDPSNQIPQFYFPKGVPLDTDEEEKLNAKISEIFVAPSLAIEEFKDVTAHICQLPKSVYKVLFTKLTGSEAGSLEKSEFLSVWNSTLKFKS